MAEFLYSGDTAALAAVNGFKALAESTLKDAINGARRSLLAEAQTKLAEAQATLAAAEKVKDKKAIAHAKIRLFEAGEALAVLRPLENETPKQEAEQNYLTDDNCLKRLVDTGFIMINTRIQDKTTYMVKKCHTVLDVFDELARMTGSEKRARAIMFQNMSRVKSTLDRHRPKHSLKT
jgi:hypothetical protein